MKTFIKWAGGKEKELPFILSQLPKNFDRYIEPFVGGGAVYFAINSKKSYINDKSCELIDLYKYIRKIGYMGASIPICNFGSLMMKGVKMLVKTQGLLGIVNGVFYITGGVITFCVFLSLIVVVFTRAKS